MWFGRQRGKVSAGDSHWMLVRRPPAGRVTAPPVVPGSTNFPPVLKKKNKTHNSVGGIPRKKKKNYNNHEMRKTHFLKKTQVRLQLGNFRFQTLL